MIHLEEELKNIEYMFNSSAKFSFAKANQQSSYSFSLNQYETNSTQGQV